jgi:hypothetical protein
MLGQPLAQREWTLPPVDSCKRYIAAEVAAAEARNQPLNRNQKKRLKKKYKKRLDAGQIIQPIPIVEEGGSGVGGVRGGGGDPAQLRDDARGGSAERDSASPVRCRSAHRIGTVMCSLYVLVDFTLARMSCQ